MKYMVRVHRLARLDLSEAYAWARGHAPHTADQWFDRFREAIRSLETAPDRCPLAVENSKTEFEIRELHFGKRPNVFRIIYHMDDDIVRVLRIRRGQRRFLTRRQIVEAMQEEEPPGLESRWLSQAAAYFLDAIYICVTLAPEPPSRATSSP